MLKEHERGLVASEKTTLARQLENLVEQWEDAADTSSDDTARRILDAITNITTSLYQDAEDLLTYF